MNKNKEKELRPVLTIGRTPLDYLLEVLALAILVALIGFSFAAYAGLPEQVPVHFNLHGEADRWGNRAGVWFLPALGLIIWMSFTWLSGRPHTFNYLNRITETNAKAQYTNALRMLRTLKVTTGLLFSLIQYHTYAMALNLNGVPGWSIGATIAATSVVSLYFLVRSSAEK